MINESSDNCPLMSKHWHFGECQLTGFVKLMYSRFHEALTLQRELVVDIKKCSGDTAFENVLLMSYSNMV